MRTKGKTTKTNSNPNGLEAVLNNLNNMLAQNTKVLNTLVTRISGGRIGKAKGIVETDSRSVVTKPQRELFDADNVFMETLKKIGRASTTREVAIRLTNDDKDMKKMYRKNKEQFMQFLYTSASNLAKEGKIKRAPAGKRRFMYSIKETGKKK